MKDCEHLKEGIFTTVDVEGSLVTIVRTKDKQFENSHHTSDVYVLNIHWTSDCKYILTNPRVVRGNDTISSERPNDTLFNEIIDVEGIRHTVVCKLTGYDQNMTFFLEKADPSVLYRDLKELRNFRDFGGASYGSSLIDERFGVAYEQHNKRKTDYVLAFEEALLIDHASRFRMLDHILFKMSAGQRMAIRNCRYEGHFDKEIVAVYQSENENEEAKIVNAWRMNRKTLKIELVDLSKVKFKASDENLPNW